MKKQKRTLKLSCSNNQPKRITQREESIKLKKKIKKILLITKMMPKHLKNHQQQRTLNWILLLTQFLSISYESSTKSFIWNKMELTQVKYSCLRTTTSSTKGHSSNSKAFRECSNLRQESTIQGNIMLKSWWMASRRQRHLLH